MVVRNGIWALCLAMLLISCSEKKSSSGGSTPPAATVKAKGDRVLGLHITEPASGFTVAFDQASRLNFDQVNMHFFWGVGGFAGTLPGTPLEVNSSANCSNASTYDMTYVGIAQSYYPTKSKKVTMTIGTYDGPNKFVPTCAKDLAFDSATMIQMFKYLVDNIFTTLAPDPQLDLQSFVIGNEIDSHADLQTCTASPLESHWESYRVFFDVVSAYIKTTYKPNLKVGITATFSGLTDLNKQPCFSALLQNADFVSVTYYPLNTDFTHKDPSVVDADFAKITSMYPGKTIYFQEVGYSSGSSYTGSNETNQSQFYKNIFTAWDKYYDQIKLISVVNVHEWSSTQVDGYGVMYGICPTYASLCLAFKDYLQTLGLRTNAGDGTDKAAFQTIINETQKRGW